MTLQLNRRIAVAAGDISDNPRIVGRVHRSLENRCRLCIAENGRPFEKLLKCKNNYYFIILGAVNVIPTYFS